MRMINGAEEKLEDLWRYNDLMREQEKDIPRQEEYWIEDEQIRKAQEEVEERKKKSEMDACMNKEQQFTEYQQAAKSAMEHTK